MIILRTYRQYVKTATIYFFDFIRLAKQTRLNNLSGHNLASEEYMSAVVINCILDEIEYLMDRKLVLTKKPRIKFEFTEAQGVLYKTLLVLPIPKDQIYFNQVRYEWISCLDQELIRIGIYEANKIHKLKLEDRMH